MKRALKLWSCSCVLTLCALPLVAQPRTPSLPADRAVPAPRGVVDSRFLFFALTPELAAGTPESLAFRIDVDGQPFLVETLDLRQVRGAESFAFELLATRPDLRDRLHELGRDPKSRVVVQVAVDGAVVREFASFGELLRYNREIKRFLRPAAAPSEVYGPAAGESPKPAPLARLFEKGYQADPACLSQCQYEYQYCISGPCYEAGASCVFCEDLYQSCLESCPIICVEPKSVTEYYTPWQTISTIYGSYNCYENWWENDFLWGTYYQHVSYSLKRDRVRRTESCNGQVTETVLSTQYSNSSCWQPTGASCYMPPSRFSGWSC
ncbi:MAG TPA: hypothetical protein VEL74_09775 [Thermoanaerobaculia bacterium]|nr:hypothetical protein [Thermoanaerobaculia bacterium]